MLFKKRGMVLVLFLSHKFSHTIYPLPVDHVRYLKSNTPIYPTMDHRHHQIEAIVECSTHAMTLLWEDGDPEPSLKILNAGLGQLMALLQHDEEDDEVMMKTNDDMSPREPRAVNLRLSWLEMNGVLGPDEERQETFIFPKYAPNNSFGVFRQVIVIKKVHLPSDDDDDDLDEEAQYENEEDEEQGHNHQEVHAFSSSLSNLKNLFYVMLMYNRAVILQDMALFPEHHHGCRYTLLHHARASYQAAVVQLIQQPQHDKQDFTMVFCALVQEVLLNNLGHVASLLDDATTMGICWNHLTSISSSSFRIPERSSPQTNSFPSSSPTCHHREGHNRDSESSWCQSRHYHAHSSSSPSSSMTRQRQQDRRRQSQCPQKHFATAA